MNTTKLTVLLVDDDDEQREYLSHKFTAHGCRILQASNPVDALALAGTNAIDIVVSDFLMPGGKDTGVELLQTLGSRPGPRPVLVLTTGFVEFLPEEAFKLSEMAVVFTKPFDAEKLISTAFERISQKASA